MAVTNINGTTQTITGAFAYDTLPYMAFGWMRHPTTSAGALYATGELDGQSSQSRMLGATNGTGSYQIWSRTTTTATASNVDNTLNDTWRAISGAWIASTERHTRLNALSNINTSTRALEAQTASRIGSWMDGGVTQVSWSYAELSLWDVAGFTTQQIQDLHDRLRTADGGGDFPDARTVNEDVSEAWTGKLVRYWKLEDNTDLADYMGSGNTWSITGTVNTATHPPIAAYSATGPTLTSPTVTSIAQTTATVGCTTDDNTGTLYTVVTTSSEQPSAAQIKAGQDHTGTAATFADSVTSPVVGANTFSATGLTANTAYWAYFIHTDGGSDDSNILSTDFSTLAAVSPGIVSDTLKEPNESDQNVANASNVTVRIWHSATIAGAPDEVLSDQSIASGVLTFEVTGPVVDDPVSYQARWMTGDDPAQDRFFEVLNATVVDLDA
jgi:hypothetical protein